ncbi:MAG: hydroxymethylbilane synthase [Phenylobacterium sp.]|uniref:hydroxymethylbilane synthase n=1 Tax=Phenylobacterium sp. TaxID=1871053 RepID=UPI002A35C3EB|nr:hydroxymethylbilane synthase [Phenylobacterium sp.]MDX9998543.1 hydroxymethylbilane synthase [Phenylobacterium sp.]
MATQPLVRIGARGSKLSLAQAGQIQRRIAVALGYAPEEADVVAPLVVITTTGDRVQDRRLLEIGGKALFTKEIEEALLDGRIDCAIHSMKDVPAECPDGLTIAAIPEREDPRDAFLSNKADRLEDLPQGARLGTASLRRQAQSLHRRPDLDVQLLRGNIDTRLRKLNEGEVDATLLALAGMKRLGLEAHAKSILDPYECPPAPGQGALAVETWVKDQDAPWLEAIRDPATTLAVAAERGALRTLEGSCRTPIGAHAWMAGGQLQLVVEALTPDGKTRFRREGSAELSALASPFEAAQDLGTSLATAIREEAGEAIVFG